MVAITSAKQGQFLAPVPAIGQKVEFAGQGQAEALKDLLGQVDFRVKRSASFNSLGMVEPGSQGQD